MKGNSVRCNCNRSLAVIAAVFASAAMAAILAQDRCLDSGGRLSDVAWSCEFAGGEMASLWSLVSPGIIGALIVVVAIPVYLAVNVMGRRWLFKVGHR